MRQVLILGAGASFDYDAHDWYERPGIDPLLRRSIPTTDQLLARAAREGVLTEAQHRPLLTAIQQHFGVSFSDLVASTRIDVETVYTRFQQDAEAVLAAGGQDTDAYIKYLHADEPRAQLLEVLQNVISWEVYACGTSATHEVLARHCATNSFDVLSFNWDTLLEDALSSQSAWHYESGYGIQYGAIRTDHGPHGVSATDPCPCRVLKPHGSINWYRYKFPSFSNSPFTGETVSSKELASTNVAIFTPSYRRLSHPRDLTLNNLGWGFNPPLKGPIEMDMVPPGKTKAAMRSSFVSIRHQILEVFAAAERITVVGFGMKNADSDTLELIRRGRHAQGRPIEVEVINPSVDTAYTERCQAVFAPCKLSVPHRTLREYCAANP